MADNRLHGPSTPSPAGFDQTYPAKAQAQKRKRVSVACRSCRTRKSRCDGGQPCSTCEDMGTECRYDQPCSQPVAITGSGTSDLLKVNTLLEQRLQAIEQKLHVLGSEKHLNRSPGVHRATSLTDQEGQNPQDTTGLTRSEGQDDGVDGMGAVALKDGADEDEYFGSSSNVAFLRFIIHAVGHPVNPTNDLSHSTVDVPADMRQLNDAGFDAFLRRPSDINILAECQRKVHVDPFALPSHAEADSLLRLYFSTVNLMIPCIHEETFRDTYMKMQRVGLGGLRRSWLGVLNVIFAIATNVTVATSPTQEGTTRSYMYFERALELVRSDILGRPSLEIVQLFILMETYLEGTTSSSLTWTFHSLAVKGAYQLGLHSAGSKSLSHLDREVRRRLWHWCVINDRFLSVTHGRPPLIPLSHVRIGPSPYLPFSNVSSGTTRSSLAYFDAMISITHIMGDAVDRLYDQNLGFRASLPMSEALDQISRLCWKLAQWQDNLPSTLKILTARDTLDDVPLTLGTTRFRVLLSLRYLGARVLILRPTLSQFLDLPNMTASNEHQTQWLRNSGAALLADLVRTCSDVLQISKNILASSNNDQNLLGAWWFSCYYTFNASLAVLGVLLVNKIPAYSGELSMFAVDDLRALLDTAMEILQGLDKGNKIIMRCRDTLTRLLMTLDFDKNVPGLRPPSFSLSPSSVWAWQLMDPSLFISEASLSLTTGAFDTANGLSDSTYSQP
ncbi:putative Zn(II)2Cys6 transcription factor [Aspergillus ambiguus]|uniref:putative Zn(II)2Cys6 transcription factor n=1 Tax=Aspergillus ambiguus TaxID=176160 RepID=UPI003CCD4E44